MGKRRRIAEACRSSLEDAEGLGPVLVAAFEQQLQPEADPEVRQAFAKPVADRGDQILPHQAVHRGTGGADAGHDERVHPVPDECRASVDQDDLGPDPGQGLLDAHEVARAVVDNTEPGSTAARDSAAGHRAHVEPFVDARP
jgi:hypothetical protein